MNTAYDPKTVAVSALGLACFALGFSVTAVAYPNAARAAEVAPAPNAVSTSNAAAPSAPRHPTPSGARGCRPGA